MPDTQKEHEAGEGGDPLVRMWFETTLGVRYEMPDMMPHQVSAAHRNLDDMEADKIIVFNISEVCLVLPRRILKKAGAGDRCFWEAT